MLTRLERIEALRLCEDKIRDIRQSLEAEERREQQKKTLRERKLGVG